MKRLTRRPIALLILAVAAIFFLWFWGRQGAPAARVLFSPLVRWFYTGAANINKVGGEQAELLRQLAVRDSEIEELRRDQEELEAAVNYRRESQNEFIAARVIGYANDRFRKMVFLDRGREHGITEGASVMIRGGIFAGTVARVDQKSSLVLLAVDKESRVPAHLLGRTDTLGVLEGHGVLYRLTLVPRGHKVEPGEIVVTGRLGTNLLPGQVIGVVSGVSEEEHSPFQTIFVSPLADFSNFSYVSVFKPLITLAPSL